MRAITSLKTLLTLLVLLLAMPALALDEATVNRWADSMEALQAWAEQEGIADESMAEMDDPADLDFERMLADAAREHPGAERVIRDAGFSGAEEWASVGGRIFNAWVAEEVAADSDAMDAEMDQALRDIEDNPHMSEEQKQMMRQQLEQMRGMQAEMSDAPESDRAAVRQARSRLEQIMDVPQAHH